MSKPSPIEQLVALWRSQTELHPPAAEAEVRNMLTKAGKPFADDLVALYCLTGGMNDWETDDALFSFWKLDRVLKENLETQTPYLLFSDFLIFSHCYGVTAIDDDHSRVHIWHNAPYAADEIVAESIAQFAELYLAKEDRLLLMH